jgi:hypothetical protein
MSKITSLLSALCTLAFTIGSAEAQTGVGSLMRQPNEAQPAAPAQAEAPPAPDQGVIQFEFLQNAPRFVVTPPSAPAAPAQPRFIVRATTLHANRETDDWSPSDEIYAVFTLRGPDQENDASDIQVRTLTFEDFDTGETKSFSPSQNCLTSVVTTQDGWDCHAQGDIGPLQFTVKLCEEDTWNDDLIGERTVQWSREELAAAMLQVGGGSEESIRIGGYMLTWRVERVS